MEESTELKKRFWRKGAVIVLGFCLLEAIFPSIAGDYLGMPSNWATSAGFVILGLALALALALWGGKYPKARGSYIVDRYPSEFDRLAADFEKTADETILQKMGREAYQQLYLEELASLTLDGFFQECANNQAVKDDGELRCYILAKKANFEAKEDDYARAEECLREALALKPQTFLLWMRLAEVSERLGAGAEAISAYEHALTLAPEKPQIMEYLRAQIRLVQTRGPRKQPPMQGLRYIGLG
jgi:tetratricopeptide (TPR) repeat protein